MTIVVKELLLKVSKSTCGLSSRTCRCSTYVIASNNTDCSSDLSAVALILKNIGYVGNPYFLVPGIKFCHFLVGCI